MAGLLAGCKAVGGGFVNLSYLLLITVKHWRSDTANG